MRFSLRLQTITAVLTFTMVSTSARADDWPQWLGPQRDGIWRETGIIDKFPEGGPKVRWRVPVGSGYAGPAVAGGRVYASDRRMPKDERFVNKAAGGKNSTKGSERILCLDEATGKKLWQHA